MSEKWFPVPEPRLRSEDTYLIPPTDLTNRRLKRSIVAKPSPRRLSPYPPVVKKKPAKMTARSPPPKAPKATRPTLIDNDSDMPGGLQLALIGPADPSGGAAGGLPLALPTPFPPVDPLQTVKTDPPGAGALDPAGGAKRKTGNGNGKNGNGNGQKTQEEIEKERAAREAELQKEQERVERMRLREEKAEQEKLARLKKQEADNNESQRLEKERQERDYRTQEELVKRQMEKERLA
jgi:MAP7 domain-containing protein 1